MTASLCEDEAREERKLRHKREKEKKKDHQSLDPVLVLMHGWSRSGDHKENKTERERKMRARGTIDLFYRKPGTHLLCKLLWTFCAILFVHVQPALPSPPGSE